MRWWFWHSILAQGGCTKESQLVKLTVADNGVDGTQGEPYCIEIQGMPPQLKPEAFFEGYMDCLLQITQRSGIGDNRTVLLFDIPKLIIAAFKGA
jgi:hypothetical protein